MRDELLSIILIAISVAIFFFYYIISKKIASWVFNHLSPTAKEGLTKYYKANFFSALINGAIAGLCVGPFYSISWLVSDTIIDWTNYGFKIIDLFKFFMISAAISFFSIFCSLFGIVFWLLSDLLLLTFKRISKSNPIMYIKGELNNSNQLPLLFVLIFFGAMIISQSFPNINMLTCLVLSGCLELGKKLCQWIVGYFACKCTNVFKNKFQSYGSIIIFLISLFCIFLSCIYGKSIDFVKFGNRILVYGPLLFYFSFYDVLLKSSFVKEVSFAGLELAIESLRIYPSKLSDIKAESSPIYFFSSALSFVLTFILTRSIGFSLVAIVLVTISVKKPKFKWMYVAFGIVVSFRLWHYAGSIFIAHLLSLTVLFLYAISFLVIEYLKTITWKDIDIRNQIEMMKKFEKRL